MNICGYIPESINEGYGLRSVIFISGCRHYCRNCHSPESWNFNAGVPFTLKEQDDLIEEVKNNPLLDGITIAGGDPFFSANEVSEFIKRLKSSVPDINIWIYSGFTYDEILQNQDYLSLLKLCHILIDGRFVNEQKDLTLLFRGSKNQRIIDIHKSLESNSVQLFAQ